MAAVDIHQMQVRYEPMEDRLLIQVRTRGGDLYAVWLTRRMALRLWPPFQDLVTRIGVAQAAPQATVLPEARDMLAQAARERPLPNADFQTRFDASVVSQPLGPEPLLPASIDLGPGPKGGVLLKVREHRARSLELRLGDDLATALARLMEKALASADWGIVAAASASTDAERPVGPLS
jgi:hypothetical protein